MPMKTGSCKRAYGTSEAELDQFSISGTKMFQMVWIRRRGDLAGFQGPVGLVDGWSLETSEDVDQHSEDAAQEDNSREDRRKAENKIHALSSSRGLFH